ncbi:MAG: RNB domain-containing ribonuclease, partial [Arcobacteraceae bacterium]
MDKSIFIKLYEGYATSNDDEIKYLNNLLKADIVKLKENQYFLDTKYKIGTIQFQKNFAVLNDLSSDHTNLKLEFDNLNGALDGDLVIVKRVFNPRSHSQSKVVKILTSKSENILVFIKNHAMYTVKESILIKNHAPNDLNEGNVFLYNNKDNVIVEHLGNISDAKIDEKISLFLYTEYYRLSTPIDINPNDYDLNNFSSRVDLRHLPFCTIDPSSAKDHDDAIYYDANETTLYVAIADVSYFVEENSALDKLALKKSTSVYLPNKVLPMLPSSLSEELCSLKENAVRFAYVFKMVLDKENACVKNSTYFEAVIQSHKNFSYGRIDRVLEGRLDQYNATEKTIFDYLLPLYELS